MSLIKMKDETANKYCRFLDTYRKLTGKEPGPSERTEAFFCAKSTDNWKSPSWI